MNLKKNSLIGLIEEGRKSTLATSSGLTMTAEMKAAPAADKARSTMVNCASECACDDIPGLTFKN